MKIARLLLFISLVAGLLWLAVRFEIFAGPPFTDRSADRPNILLIVADDMGIADIGAFGSEIPTPHLDALAYSGIRLNNFHVSPTCSPTRATLFTGVDHHLAGLGNMAEELAPNQTGQPGYEGHLNFAVAPVMEILRAGGYHTYFSGKWHLGKTPETSPYSRGFEQSFSMLSGAADHFNDLRPVYAPTPDTKTPYRENGVLLDRLPDDFHYSTQFYTDRLLEQIDSNPKSEQPFFAVCWPIRRPIGLSKPPVRLSPAFVGHYDEGFDVIVERRLQRQKELGLIATEIQPAPRALKGLAWEQLTPDQQQTEIRAMEIYAAMIDQIDHHVGRLVAALKERGLYENTVLVFISDDGAEGHDLDETWPKDMFPKIRQVGRRYP